QGRGILPKFTVRENLTLGTFAARSAGGIEEWVLELFPVLKDFLNRYGGNLSGGQQQMAAIGRALMSNPRLLLCDEISLGLAPVVVEQIYRSFADIRREGTAVVLVEQDVKRALATS
ncbi:ATP-binding cassette domain-containing protein, partial [Escherichia coli]|uniref:ATP-binding cassette domain-containing protein n=1 Tax=Escherichia coli TaxID=562 RepID=UPI001330BD58